MIARIWYGYTSPQNADAYEVLLRTEIFPGILARDIAGVSAYRTTARTGR
jgi:hypothetical protein